MKTNQNQKQSSNKQPRTLTLCVEASNNSAHSHPVVQTISTAIAKMAIYKETIEGTNFFKCVIPNIDVIIELNIRYLVNSLANQTVIDEDMDHEKDLFITVDLDNVDGFMLHVNNHRQLIVGDFTGLSTSGQRVLQDFHKQQPLIDTIDHFYPYVDTVIVPVNPLWLTLRFDDGKTKGDDKKFTKIKNELKDILKAELNELSFKNSPNNQVTFAIERLTLQESKRITERINHMIYNSLVDGITTTKILSDRNRLFDIRYYGQNDEIIELSFDDADNDVRHNIHEETKNLQPLDIHAIEAKLKSLM